MMCTDMIECEFGVGIGISGRLHDLHGMAFVR